MGEKVHDSQVSGPNPIRVVIVDGHELVRSGLRTVLLNYPRFELVGEASTAAQALAAVRRGSPDIALVDVRLPDGSGVDLCREIVSACPPTRVLMLTSYTDEETLIAAILAGASGYLLKDINTDRLVRAMDTVAHGDSLIDRHLVHTMLDWIRRVGPHVSADPLGHLPERHREILRRVGEGKTNRQIAAELYLSEFTVKNYVSDLLRRLHCARRAELAAFAAVHYLSDSAAGSRAANARQGSGPPSRP